MSFKPLEARKVYNDVIDEVYEMEDEPEVPDEHQIKNDVIDEEIQVSDDSENYIPTPRDEEDYEDEGLYEETDNVTKRVLGEEGDEEHSEFAFGKENKADSIEKQIEELNLDQETKDLFKYIKVNCLF